MVYISMGCTGTAVFIHTRAPAVRPATLTSMWRGVGMPPDECPMVITVLSMSVPTEHVTCHVLVLIQSYTNSHQVCLWTARGATLNGRLFTRPDRCWLRSRNVRAGIGRRQLPCISFNTWNDYVQFTTGTEANVCNRQVL